MNDDPSQPDDTGQRPPGVRVTAAKCVRCAQSVQPRYRPFCSQRCADADLEAWFTGRYRVETNEVPQVEAGDDAENHEK
jgi:endogenous inhibitor of DNA gyrase (YacG/DUF329 family)